MSFLVTILEFRELGRVLSATGSPHTSKFFVIFLVPILVAACELVVRSYVLRMTGDFVKDRQTACFRTPVLVRANSVLLSDGRPSYLRADHMLKGGERKCREREKKAGISELEKDANEEESGSIYRRLRGRSSNFIQ
ncbi:hypothetical protein KSP39_PZI024429 [Platanthera zijinensis]|uniref:Uncharacterized protein n=1 Tax=Platanthera zijinensis TaxID=2320716 RepID=A0AAP0ATH8_9ASPA